MTKKTAKLSTIDEQIDTIIYELFERSKLTPEGTSYPINLKVVLERTSLNEADFYSFVFGVLNYEWDAINISDFSEKAPIGEAKVRINHTQLTRYLRENRKISDGETAYDYSEKVEKRGRKTKIDWDFVHVQIAEMIQRDAKDFFIKQDSTAAEIKEWLEKDFGEAVGVSTIKEKLKPYWAKKDKFIKD